MKDIIIIGAGPGGYELAVKAALEGLSVLLIEKDKLGGTCLQRGCIPTKSYYHSAAVLREIAKATDYGINGNFNFNFEKTFLRKEKIVVDLTQGISFLLKKNKVEVMYGQARLKSANEVVVNDTVYRSRYIILATGSKPILFPPFNTPSVITSDTLLALREIPKKLAIIGGGVIGIEFASIFNAFGCAVEVFELADSILPMFDKEISRRLQAYIKSQGIIVHTGARVIGVEDKGKIYYRVNNEEKQTSADKILVSVGRAPNVEELGLEETGIIFDNKGIRVNGNFQTNIKNIYAIGDVTGKMMLAHSATYSGYHALNHILNRKSPIDFNILPSCVFTFPEVAMVGLTETECAKHDYEVYKAYFRTVGKAITINAPDGFIKIILSNKEIVGVHIIGPNASDLIHEAVILMNKKIPLDQFVNFIHAHPTLSEVYHSALYQ